SPHIIKTSERIRLNGSPIDDNDFAKYAHQIWLKLSLASIIPHYFEFLTAMSFAVFCSKKVDVAIFEVGIGGLYDCTNVLRQSDICIVTPIGYDHCNILGNSLEEIAFQKSGIFKKNSVVVSANQQQSVLKVLRKRAKELETASFHYINFGGRDAFEENYMLAHWAQILFNNKGEM
ncbi:hypothetical protein GJ496_009571, partial [Pomphorhynchus laevis]